MSNSKQIKSCQICKNKNLKSILFLGYLPPVNQFNDLNFEAKEQPSYPAELLFCKNSSTSLSRNVLRSVVRPQPEKEEKCL